MIADIRMPPTGDAEGIRVARELRQRHPNVGVVVLSQYAGVGYALALLEDHAEGRGYLLKERVHDRAELVAALEVVAQGGTTIDPSLVRELIAAERQQPTSPIDELTPREREVLAEMAAGKSNAAIAESLVLTKRAVEKHVGRSSRSCSSKMTRWSAAGSRQSSCTSPRPRAHRRAIPSFRRIATDRGDAGDAARRLTPRTSLAATAPACHMGPVRPTSAHACMRAARCLRAPSTPPFGSVNVTPDRRPVAQATRSRGIGLWRSEQKPGVSFASPRSSSPWAGSWSPTRSSWA